MNAIARVIVVFFVGIAGFLLTFPELPLVPLVITAAVVAAVFTVVFYPFSKTIWTANDLQLRPPEPEEVAEGYGEWIQRGSRW